MPTKWNDEIIKERLIELHKQNTDLSDSGLRKYDKTLHRAVVRRFRTVSKALEVTGINPGLYRKKQANFYWTRERILAEFQVLKARGEKLSFQNLRDNYPKLLFATLKKFDSLNEVLRLIDVSQKETSRLYANTKEFKCFLEKELTAEKLNELYWVQWLTQIEIGDQYGCGYKPIQRLMRNYGISTRESIYGIKGKLTCKDGHRVRSSHERRIDNWFYSKGVPHEVESPIIKDKKYTADFRVGRFFVEILGLYHNKSYKYHYSEKYNDIANAQPNKSFRYIILSNEMELNTALSLTSKEEIEKRYGNDVIILEIRLAQNHYPTFKEIEQWFGFLADLYSTQTNLSGNYLP